MTGEPLSSNQRCAHGEFGDAKFVPTHFPHNYDCPYCEIERLIALHADVWRKYNDWRGDAERLRAALREVYEIWAGSDGMIPETAPEAYQERLIHQMRDAAKRGLADTGRYTADKANIGQAVHADPTGKTREPPHCPTCDCGTP